MNQAISLNKMALGGLVHMLLHMSSVFCFNVCHNSVVMYVKKTLLLVSWV